MLFADHLVVMRGGGDLATGVAYRLNRAGFPVVVLELPAPRAVRRKVAVAAAVTEGEVEVEGLVARLVSSPDGGLVVAREGVVAVVVSETLPAFTPRPRILIDARMLKRASDTSMSQADLVVGLGPGLTAGTDCHAVVETMRGHDLGRVIWDGPALPSTGTPGRLGGLDEMRVLRAEGEGPVAWSVSIGDHVVREQLIGAVGDTPVRALTSGVLRGLIAPGFMATPGLKIGDVDPRADPTAAERISDKALAVGGGVLEAVLVHLNRTS